MTTLMSADGSSLQTALQPLGRLALSFSISLIHEMKQVNSRI